MEIKVSRFVSNAAAASGFAVAAVVALQATNAQRDQITTLPDLLGRATAYVLRLGNTFGTILCDEALTQSAIFPGGSFSSSKRGDVANTRSDQMVGMTREMSTPKIDAWIARHAAAHQGATNAVSGAPAGRTLQRRVRADAAFLSLAEDHSWVFARHVHEMDGRSVETNRDRLPRALVATGPSQVTRLAGITALSAQYLLEFEPPEPMLVLQILLPEERGQFTFTLRGADKIDGVAVRQLDFVGRSAPARGSLWILGDGTVARTALTVDSLDEAQRPVGKTSITVSYTRSDALAMWPSRVDERDEQRLDGRSIDLTTRATYSNCRPIEADNPR